MNRNPSQRTPRQQVSWEKYVKKYVWDSDSTPYLIPVRRLKQYQADKELFLYAFFIATPSAMLMAGVVGHVIADGVLDNLAVGLYGLSMLCAAVALRLYKKVGLALYTVTAPIALLLHFAVNGFPERLHTFEQLLLVIVTLFWLRYSVRVVAIANAYDSLSSIKKDDNPWTKLSAGGPPPG